MTATHGGKHRWLRCICTLNGKEHKEKRKGFRKEPGSTLRNRLRSLPLKRRPITGVSISGLYSKLLTENVFIQQCFPLPYSFPPI